MLPKSNTETKNKVVIIDFDNLITNDVYTSYQLEIQLKEILEILAEDIDRGFISVRLYGGWYSKGNFTPKASILQQHLASVKLFPILKRNPRKFIEGRIDLVSSLVVLPDLIWDNTVVERSGIRQVRFVDSIVSQICLDNEDVCPLSIMKKFTKKKNRTCSVHRCDLKHSDVFKNVTQKMVDNMIACDYISLCNDENVTSVLVASDDTDLFPSYILGSIKAHEKLKIVLYFKNQSHSSNWTTNLKRDNIEIKTKQYDNR